MKKILQKISTWWSERELNRLLKNSPWFVDRMMMDNWGFGLVLQDGTMVCICQINKIHRWHGHEWLEVELMSQERFFHNGKKGEHGFPCVGFEKILCGHDERPTASIRMDSVVAAFEGFYT